MRGSLFWAAVGAAAALMLMLGGTASSYGPAPASTWVVSGGQFGVGSVHAIATEGSTAYVGGAFGYVGPETGSFVSLDTAGEALTKPWPVVDGSVSDTVPDGSGGWFIGGEFTSIGGQPVSSLAHIKSDGTLDTDWEASAGGAVFALLRSGTTLYAAGDFTSAGDEARRDLAAFDTATGTVTSFNPDVSGNGDSAWLSTLALSGSTLYVGGTLLTFGDEVTSHGQLAAIDTTTASGTVTGWSPDVNGRVGAIAVGPTGTVYVIGAFSRANGDTERLGAAAFDQNGTLLDWNPEVGGELRAIALSASEVYLGGEFWTVGTEERTSLAAVDPISGEPTSWVPPVHGQVRELAVSGSTLYAGGRFQTVDADTERDNLAAFNTQGTGETAPFRPVIAGDVEALGLDGGRIVVGGAFDSAGGSADPNLRPVRRNNLAAVDLTTGKPTPWHGETDSIVYALRIGGSRLIAGGAFNNVDKTIPRSSLASFSLATGDATDWDPHVFGGTVYALAVDGGTVYAGGQFDHVNLGTPRASLAAFSTTGDGTALPWNPAVTSCCSVRALDVNDGTIYIGGLFGEIGGVTRTRLAAVDASGAVLPWDPRANDIVYALTHVGSTVYAGGNFSRVNGNVGRGGVAAFQSGGSGTATSWNPRPGTPGIYSGSVRALAATASTMYLAGEFENVGNCASSCIYSPELAAVTLSTGAPLTTWQPAPNDELWALGIAPQGLVAGGSFTAFAYPPTPQPGVPIGPAVSYRAGLALVPALPDAPVVSTTPGNGSATIGIQEPAYLGGAAVSSYTVEASPGGTTVTTAAGPVALSGLTNGVTYTISVTATTSGGTGPAGVATVTPHNAPGAPANVTATAGNGSATVSFSPPSSNGGEAIGSYTVTAQPGGLSASGTSSPIVLTGLKNGESYTFTVTAANSAGSGPASSPSAPVTPTEGGREEEPTPPTVPRADVPEPPSITTPRPPPPHHS